MKKDPILTVVAYAMVPIIMMFGLYVQFHGDISPGGGFQSGAILASGIMLYSFMVGSEIFLHVFPLKLLERLSSIGVFIYAFVGVVTMAKGGNFLDYSILFKDNAVLGQEVGVFLVELGVCITVFSTFLMIYFNLNDVLENNNDI
jgi:multicomponent Na+:H+ antiporter subunit B